VSGVDHSGPHATGANRATSTVQLGRPGWERNGATLQAEFPEFSWLVVHTDRLDLVAPNGTITTVEWDDAVADVVWMDLDVFRSDVQARHFKLAATGAVPAWVHTSYAGLENPYWDSIRSRGSVLSLSHLSGVPISEYVMSQVLQRFQASAGWDKIRQDHAWTPGEFRELHGSTWLVVGLGAIGAKVANLANAFGAEVTGVRQHIRGDETIPTIAAVDLAGVRGAADVIVFCVPGGSGSDGLVDAEFLAGLGPNTLIVNVGRGSLIDEPALLTALDAGQLGGAILDVTATEPLPADDPLWNHSLVWITPHGSAAGSGRHQRSLDAFIENLHRWISHEAIPHSSA